MHDWGNWRECWETDEAMRCVVFQMNALGKKYDQRFKAAGEVSSRLQAEEAAFRDIQVRARRSVG